MWALLGDIGNIIEIAARLLGVLVLTGAILLVAVALLAVSMSLLLSGLAGVFS